MLVRTSRPPTRRQNPWVLSVEGFTTRQRLLEVLAENAALEAELTGVWEEADALFSALELCRQESDEQPASSHTPDFRQVRWRGVAYRFSPAQSRVVALLWEKKTWLDGALSESYLQAWGEFSSRVAVLFYRSEAWGKVIVKA